MAEDAEDVLVAQDDDGQLLLLHAALSPTTGGLRWALLAQEQPRKEDIVRGPTAETQPAQEHENERDARLAHMEDDCSNTVAGNDSAKRSQPEQKQNKSVVSKLGDGHVLPGEEEEPHTGCRASLTREHHHEKDGAKSVGGIVEEDDGHTSQCATNRSATSGGGGKPHEGDVRQASTQLYQPTHIDTAGLSHTQGTDAAPGSGPDAKVTPGLRAHAATLAPLRYWFPPMLNDTYRNACYADAIVAAVASAAVRLGRAPVVLDLGA